MPSGMGYAFDRQLIPKPSSVEFAGDLDRIPYRTYRLTDVRVQVIPPETFVFREGAHQHTSHDSIQVIGLDAVIRGLDGDIVAGDPVSHRQIAGRHQLFSHFVEGSFFAWIRALSTIAQCKSQTVQVARHSTQSRPFEGECMIGAL